jgi:uncharacterized membrane protein YhdT
METWVKIIAILFAWWAFSVALAFRKGRFVKYLQQEAPVLFLLPHWLSTVILIFAMLIIAPYVMLEPFSFVRELWLNWKLRMVAARTRKMSKGQNSELKNLFEKLADGLDDIAKN